MQVLRADNSLIRFLLGTRYIRVGARKLIPDYVTTVPGGIRLRVRSADTGTSYMVKEIYYKNIYERFYKAKEGDMVLDIGANIGAFSLKMSKLVGEQGRVLAVEPESTNFNLLMTNMKMNHCKNILPIKTALGERPGTAFLNVYKKHGRTSFFARAMESVERQEEVSIRTLDELTSELCLSQISLVKVDTEGYELKALQGGKETIRKLKPKIVGEAHPHISDSAAIILRYLGESGYDGVIFLQDPGYEEIFYAWPRD
jgi:FkbM family methyltransferase